MTSDRDNEKRRLLTTSEAAEWLGMSVHWLKTSRFRPELDGPPFIRIGRRTVRYDIHDLNAWLDRRRYRGTHEIT
ncbi:helix-turn-helix domain-containing protein [Thalassospiraceae bacterium LMO-JJ14]|nr:helix-turn-helix domain-containing protein [Thalassospiraceae bacterium LMO-JJ14]